MDGRTDRQTDTLTDGPTCAKQNTPSSSKGGIIIIMIKNTQYQNIIITYLADFLKSRGESEKGLSVYK